MTIPAHMTQTPVMTRRAFMLGAAGLGFAVLAPGCATRKVRPIWAQRLRKTPATRRSSMPM